MENSQNTEAQDLSTLTNAGAKAPGAASAPANDPLKDLKLGDVLLVKARGVNGGKVEIEFAERIINTTVSASPSSNPLIGMLNKSDERFSEQNGPRRAWISGTKQDISDLLGVDVSSLAYGDEMVFNKLNPTVNGVRIRLRVIETVVPTPYQAENIETRAKRKGKEGEFILHKGMYIFANVDAIPSNEDPQHTFLEADVVEKTGIVATQVASTAVDTAGLAV